MLYIYFTCFKIFIYLFSERGKGREKDRERDISVREKQLVASHTPSTGGPESNFLVCQASTQSTETQQTGWYMLYLFK